jgi:hypothetical protein
MEPFPLNRGAAALVGSDVQPRSSGQSETSGQGPFHGAAASHLAFTMQVACSADDSFDVVLLVNSSTI